MWSRLVVIDPPIKSEVFVKLSVCGIGVGTVLANEGVSVALEPVGHVRLSILWRRVLKVERDCAEHGTPRAKVDQVLATRTRYVIHNDEGVTVEDITDL